MCLELIERRLDFPALVIERRQLRGGGAVGVEDRRDEAIAWLGRRERRHDGGGERHFPRRMAPSAALM